MKITNEFLKEVMPQSTESNRQKYLEWLNYFMPLYKIDTDERIEAFIANIAVESKYLASVVENVNYSVDRMLEIFKSDFDIDGNKIISEAERKKAISLKGNPRGIANFVYANQNGNGNEISGDGWKYIARGLIGITGKGNYAILSKETGEDFVSFPELLETPKCAVMSACWYFKKYVIDRGIV